MSHFSAGLAVPVVAAMVFATAAQAGNGKILADTELYSGPKTDYARVRSISSGATLVIYGCDAKFEWCDVGSDGQRGWVQSDVLAIVRGAGFVPIRELAPLAGVRVIEYDEQGYQARHYPNAVMAQTAQPVAQGSEESGEGGPAASTAAYNQAMALVAKALQSPEPAAQAGVSAPTAIANPKRTPWIGETLSDASVRSGPGSRYPRIATIGAGREIVIYGCTARYRWCDISQDNKRGWVYGPLLAATNGDELAPLVKIAKKAGIKVLKFDMETYHRQHYGGEPWQNQSNGVDVVRLGNQITTKAGGSKQTTARVIRLPGPSGSSLPKTANALQESDAGEESGNGQKSAGLLQRLPKVFGFQ